MRIIKQKPKVEKETIKTCQKCKSKLVYNESDIKQDRDGKYIECPVCSSFIGVL